MERFIGFTIPRNGTFYVCDHDEVVQISFDGSMSAEVTDEHPYRFVENNADFLGLVFDGLSANEPVLRVGSTIVSYNFDPRKDFVSVNCEIAGEQEVLEFRTFSGDWFVASLSDDGRHLVLAEPYEVALYQLR